MLSIRSLVSMSAMGFTRSSADRHALWADGRSYTQWHTDAGLAWAPLHTKAEDCLMRLEGKRWEKGADKITQMALALGREIELNAAKNTGVIMASSRGAAVSLEDAIVQHREGERIHPLTSPWTTLGTTAAWLARDLGLRGAAIDTSMTCSSGFNALYQAAALLESGMQDQMLVGAVEAPLSDFGLAQFKSLGVLSKHEDAPHCLPFHQASGNTMTMGEGGALMLLDKEAGGIAKVMAVGIGREDFSHPAAISDNGEALALAMQDAINKAGVLPEVIIPHAPGTLQGDKAEEAAIERVFGEKQVSTLSPKWKVGHTFGASGLLGIDLAVCLLHGGNFPQPYTPEVAHTLDKTPKYVLVNATGFGGNALSVMLCM